MFAEVTGAEAKSKPALYAAVYSYIEANMPKAEGRQVPPETVRKLMNQALLSKDGGWFGSDKTLAEHFRVGGNLNDFDVEVPDDVRDAIIAELKKRKKKVSEQSIQSVYKIEYMGFPQAEKKQQQPTGVH